MQPSNQNKSAPSNNQTGESQRVWLESTLGRYVLAHEQAMFDAVVSDIFGFNALQLGLLHLNALKSSRIPNVMRVGNREGDALCESDYLPFAESCIDLICLPHVLEFSRNPHQTLREAERVLVPEGHLILTGFNPISAWGLKQTLFKESNGSQGDNYPWQGHFFTLSRIRDWLALLGLEFVSGSMHAYEPPFNDEKWLKRFNCMDTMGEKWWPMLGGIYFIVAKKRVVNITLLKPNWKKRLLPQSLGVSSKPKSGPQQQKQKQKHHQ
ncbi:MAG: methyltransferase domain-containing protein [Bdellovibrio sp.]|nr:methyltransferase domain-containing protein [Methylotenera sp.]